MDQLEDFDEVAYMFAQRVSNPLEWFEHARALIGTARIAKKEADVLINLQEKVALENVCSLLYGLALENLFKAIWILKEYGSPFNETWLPKAKFPKAIRTHDLNMLAKKIDKELVEKYEYSLSLLTEAIIWSGRYPCSIHGKEGTIVIDASIHDDAEKIYSKYRKFFTISS